VLRDGALVATLHQNEYKIDEMIRLMVGRDLESRNRQAGPSGSPLLRVEKLRAPPIVREVSFEARAGEILGFAGLMGSGRTETMSALFGADPRESGQIFLGDSAIPVKIELPADAVRLGIGFLTEDRKKQGLLLPKPLRMNLTLANLRSELLRLGAWLDRNRETAVAGQWIHRLAIRASGCYWDDLCVDHRRHRSIGRFRSRSLRRHPGCWLGAMALAVSHRGVARYHGRRALRLSERRFGGPLSIAIFHRHSRSSRSRTGRGLPRDKFTTQYIGSQIEQINEIGFLGLSLPFWISIGAVIVAQLILTGTIFGRYLIALGTNEEAVRLSGIDPRPIKVIVFALSGALAGAASIALCSRLASADPNAGSGFELEAIAAVVIGGTSLMGGRGSVINSFFGVLVIAVLENGLAQLGAQEPVKRLVTGGVIVAAVIVDFYRSRRMKSV
jgi:branched-subunit amino acid ABC-type transport system permease component